MMTNVYLSKIPGKLSGKQIYDNMRSIQVKVVHIIVIFRGRGVNIFCICTISTHYER